MTQYQHDYNTQALTAFEETFRRWNICLSENTIRNSSVWHSTPSIYEPCGKWSPLSAVQCKTRSIHQCVTHIDAASVRGGDGQAQRLQVHVARRVARLDGLQRHYIAMKFM